MIANGPVPAVMLCVLPVGAWPQVHQAACPTQLCAAIDAEPAFREELRRFYKASDFRYAWVQDGLPTARALEAIEVLQHAGAHGLRPEDYSIALPASPGAAFDVALTRTALRYVSDLRFGRRDPGIYRREQDRASPDAGRELPDLVRKHILEESDLQAGIRHLEPPFDGYRRTLAALAHYRALSAADDGAQLPGTRVPVEPGQPYSGAPRLVRLLTRLGDLPLESDPLSTHYQGTLVDAVKRFQARHGLEADGRIGSATLRQLNTPLRFRVQQLELTLERWRWIPHSFARPPLVVNLPEFSVRAYHAAYAPEIQMKIVAGSAPRRRTPLLSATLQYVIFRPYWNVPLSIQREELIPLIQKDPAYIGKHGYEVVAASGKVVATDVVPPDFLPGLQSGALALRQLPGPNNALGLVKFMFPNRPNVYLHDTPARELFRKARRDFSHGCMRVERAAELAEWVLREEPGWSRQRIEAAMNGTATIRVDLKRPIPVLIVYGTAVVPDHGEVHFFSDIYGYDAALAKALAARSRSALR